MNIIKYLLLIVMMVVNFDVIFAQQAEMRVLSPVDNTISTKSTILIKGKVSNISKLELNEAVLPVTEDGQFIVELELTVENGYNFFLFQGTTPSGEIISVTRKVFYKKELNQSESNLKISLKEPLDKAIVTEELVTFQGNAQGAKKLFINDKEVDVSKTGRFSYTTTLSGHINNFVLKAIDKSNNETFLERQIIYQNENIKQNDDVNYQIPTIKISSPQNNFVTYKNMITLEGFAENANNLFINNRIVPLNSNGRFSEVFELESLGKYVFNIHAIGENGLNTTTLLKLFRITKNESAYTDSSKSLEIENKLETLISLNLAGADLSDVLSILAKKGDLNLVTDKMLAGSVFINLQDVRLIDAIDFVLNSQGLSYKIVDETIMIGSRTALDLPSRLETKIIRVNNISAETIRPILQEFIVTGELIQVQDNMLIVTVDSKKIKKITRLVEKLDLEKVPQIILEAQILEVTESVLDHLGVSFSNALGVGMEITGSDGVYTSTATLSGLSGIIHLLESQGEAKVIAKPRIKAVHGEQAEIFIGDEIPYQQTVVAPGGTFTQSYEYVNAGINLTITPEINAFTQEIKIKIAPEVSYINGYRGPNNDIPIIRSRRVNTTVYVKNKNTVLIGGLFNSTDSDTKSKVPFLSKLPFFGNVFSSNQDEGQQTELVIAITPQIIDDQFEESIPIPININNLVN